MKRSSGILMHITSLPSPYGIGSMGKSAFDFIDFLKKAGQTYWQILPINPPAPYMEKSSAWTELLSDCDEGKVNLIITQKVSNVSRDVREITICARMLAARKPPVGIYFISEDLYTLASYYRDDLREPCFLPAPDWKLLPDDELDVRGALHE